MKKIALTLSLFALSTVSFAGCFTIDYSCGGGTYYCSQENDTMDQIHQDIQDIDKFICG
ncbi:MULTISPECIES: hypothetical protein [Myroides]|uniref:Lipoprotein n=1 Tax=Myroides odoratus TaxID=256 RepID=A0A9Q6ZA91_MYROD|nr:hypothetical protein [Myroides odoratus]QQT99789.1 hypothetical protein I6I88_16720 [Myroides odoratus]WQD57996.1 hypothetical protein U0010_02230 [Myroides odoratus]